MMTLLESLLILTGVICCTAAPAPPGSCESPPRLQDKELQGEWNEEFYDTGTRANYLCRPGFSRLGSIFYKCKNGVWVQEGSGQCKKKSCGHPGDIDFGTFELKKEEAFVFGAIVEYTCNDGYQMISRQRTRECTATGWTNYRPECEVRFCPPVNVDNNVNLLTTSYEEEYSVGQVIRFECKNPGQKVKGASEIFCTSEGNWNAPPPTCEDISCSLPRIEHGSVSNSRPRYKDKDTIEFSCNPGYRSTTHTVPTCTKKDWIPVPMCEEIVCYPQDVQNGKVQFNEDKYRDGDIVTLTCNDGFQIEHQPNEPRRCTAYGWSPPLKCISKQCMQPEILNGYVEYASSYSYPMRPGRYLYYRCNYGFVPSNKESYETITCTNNGWKPDPKCYRKCNAPSEYNKNAYIFYSQNVYTEGDKLSFQCHQDHSTLDGQTRGEMKCLPDGRFSEVICHKTCLPPKLANGEYGEKSVFKLGAYLMYTCNEGFISSDNRVEGYSQCTNKGWAPNPECKEISCTLQNRVHLRYGGLTVRSGDVVHFKCQLRNYNLEGSSSSQCFYYGFSPAIPICKDEKNQTSLPILDVPKPKESKCPLISAPPNAQVVNPENEYFSGSEIKIACDSGYLLYGSEKIWCEDGKWQSPPWCIGKRKCFNPPPKVKNGQISRETLLDEYYTGSTVQYICNDDYYIIGANESKCVDDKWLPVPTCGPKPCGYPEEIVHGKAQDGMREYKHSESATYECSPGYRLSVIKPAQCSYGKWKSIPGCIYSMCGPPPQVPDGVIKGKQKTLYLPGDKVIYDCVIGYTMGESANFITCEDSIWSIPPVCRRVGQICNSPPVVQFGDILETKLREYQSNSFVTYKCANLHKLEGAQVIRCRDGEWEKPPVCRVPCTAKERDMEQNNIQLKYKWGEDKTKKLYSVHYDNMTFECKQGYEISDLNFLRIQCLDGVLKYPKCLKEGSCVLQQTEMTKNNIHYNKSTNIENGQTIEFECVDGTVSENSLQGKCINKKMNYPKCSAGRKCLPPDILNALANYQQESRFESGTSVDIECEDQYVLKGHTSVRCENGQWDELPQCLKPCTILADNLDTNNIELNAENPSDILLHGTEINVKCKARFKRPGSLIGSCYNGTMKYPRCFSGGTCRIIQQNLDDNFVELAEEHENEVYYEEEETVRFKCKTGYRSKTTLTAICTKSGKPAVYTLTYPTCEQESAM